MPQRQKSHNQDGGGQYAQLGLELGILSPGKTA